MSVEQLLITPDIEELELKLLTGDHLTPHEMTRLARRPNVEPGVAKALMEGHRGTMACWMLLQDDQPDETVRACIQDGDVFRQLLVLHHQVLGPRFAQELADSESFLVKEAVKAGLAGKPHKFWKLTTIQEATVQRILDELSFDSRMRSCQVSYEEPNHVPSIPDPFYAWLEESWLDGHIDWYSEDGGFGEFTSPVLKRHGHDWTVSWMGSGNASIQYCGGEYSRDSELESRLPLAERYDWQDPDEDIQEYMSERDGYDSRYDEDLAEELKTKREAGDEATLQLLWPYTVTSNQDEISKAFATTDVFLQLVESLGELGDDTAWFTEEALYRANERREDACWEDLRDAFEELSAYELRRVEEAYGSKAGKSLARKIKAREITEDNLEEACLVLDAARLLPRGY